MAPVITLTTDFGHSDSYVASLKGVILSICPDARIIDVSHEVPPQDILHAAYVLATAYAYVPKGSIHVAVVDPGVGSKRKGIVVEHAGHIFLAPDNGLLSLVLKGKQPKAYELTNQRYRLKSVSSTFHGRDIFAPAAAHLANGVAIAKLGPVVKKLVSLDVAAPVEKDGLIAGAIIHIDTYGNLVTNIAQRRLPKDVTIVVAGKTIRRLSTTYAEAKGLLALWGSSGYLEISLKNGNAAKSLKAKRGDAVGIQSR